MVVSEEVPILDLLRKQIYAADDISRQDFAIFFSCGEKVKEKIKIRHKRRTEISGIAMEEKKKFFQFKYARPIYINMSCDMRF